MTKRSPQTRRNMFNSTRSFLFNCLKSRSRIKNSKKNKNSITTFTLNPSNFLGNQKTNNITSPRLNKKRKNITLRGKFEKKNRLDLKLK